MLLAEELLLLAVTSQDVGVMYRPYGFGAIDLGLAGAVLMELALLDHVRLTERGEPVGAGRVVLRPGPPPAQPVLAAALERLAHRQGRKPHRAITALHRGLIASIGSGFVASGVLDVQWVRSHGFLRELIVLTDPAPVIHIRGRLGAALMQPDVAERTAALIGLLSAADALSAVFDMHGQPAMLRWAKDIADHHWATVAVRRLVTTIKSQTGFSWVMSQR